MFAASKTGKAASAAANNDPKFNYVTMLLHGDGTNGAQNNTFLDSSSNAFTITRNGTPTQGTFSPYGSLWSNYFNGSSDYLLTASSTSWAFGTGDWTMEAWVYTNSNATQRIFSINTFDELLLVINGSNCYLSYFDGTTDFGNSAVNFPLRQWVHVAATRSGGTVRVFINGSVVNTPATSSSNRTASVPCYIGRFSGSAVQYWNGYISNARIIKGTALYTGSFTPSTTPLTAVTNTSLLTCQSNRFIDNSTNNFTITANGTPSVQRFSPFEPTSAYSTSTIGGSFYSPGSGSTLTATAPALAVGTGDFTYEFWVYFTTIGTVAEEQMACTRGIGTGWQTTRRGNNWTLDLNSSGSLATATGVLTANNQWYHFAVTRQSGTIRLFTNGVLNTTVTGNTNNFTSTSFSLAALNSNTSYNLIGYISDFRFLAGAVLYTTSFTPSTAPLSAVTNTSLLLNCTNAGIYDNAMMNDLVTVGNAQVSTTQKKYGTASLYFDGTGDYLTSPISNNYVFGAGDFTIEGWFYKSSQMTPVDTIITYGWTSTATGPFVLVYNSSNQLQFYASSNGSSWDIANAISVGTFTAGTWNHFAVSRQGSSIRLFMNGTLNNTVTSSASFYVQTTYPLTIGGNGNGGNCMNGYIDDLRITKGYARYTANFTPPTAALPDN